MRPSRVRFELKYLAIQYYREEKGWSIRWMYRQLGISKAAYYKWLHWFAPESERENLLLAELNREYDQQYNHILGYRQMTLWINRLSATQFSKNRVHRIMKANESHWRSLCYSQTGEKIQEVYTRKKGGKYSETRF